MALSPLSVDM